YVYGAPASRRKYWLGGLTAAAAVILASAIGYSLYSGEEAEVAIDWSRGENSQLTDSPDVEGYPSLSPDGSTIIYESGPAGERDILSQRVGGKNAVNLTPNSPASDSMPA